MAAPKKNASVAAASERTTVKRRGVGHIGSFMTFIREQGVIGLAVGLAVGTAAGASVKSLVDHFISPIVGFILGGADLSKIVWHTGLKNGNVELTFGFGAIVSSIITLLATALVVYLIIHGAKLDRLDKKKE